MSIIILKLGGSVITDKASFFPKFREDMAKQIAKEIKIGLTDNKLILIHGAGSYGHPLVNKYGLDKETTLISTKREVVPRVVENCRILNQKMMAVLYQQNLPTAPIQTNKVIRQKNKEIDNFDKSQLESVLQKGKTPVIYGSMVEDSELGWSVCSGDNIISFLCRHSTVKKILFATDVDGLYDYDPHYNKDAKFLNEVRVSDLKEFNIKGSHNQDVSGGMLGKIEKMIYKGRLLADEVVIFNGLKKNNIRKALENRLELCTKIKRG